MAANSKYHITITYSGGEKGFLTKEYSPRQKPDSLFGSRFSTGDISYSTMNRWQRFAQTSWLGGAYQKYLEDATKFKVSNNIDILTHGEFKLSKKLGSNVYSGAAAISKGIYFNNATYFAEGRYIKYTTDEFQTAPSVSKDFGAGKVVSDLEIHDGKLYAAVGSVGVWEHTTSDHTTWNEIKDGASTIPASYLKSWGDNIYITYLNTFGYWSGLAYTLVKDFSASGGDNYYLKKPEVYDYMYIPCNVAGSTEGGGKIYRYTGTDLDSIFNSTDPVGSKMVVYEAKLLFVVYGDTAVTIKQYNGSSTTTLKSFSITPGVVIYGSGIKYGSGAKYGQGSDKYLDPVDFNVWNNNLIIIMQRTTQLNTMLIYDTYGWSEYLSFPVGSNYSAVTWVSSRILYFGDSSGNIYSITGDYAVNGFLQSSIWDADLQDIDKLFADITVKHEQLNDGDSIDIWYRDETSGEFKYLGSGNTANSIETVVPFPTGANTVISSRLEYRIVLNSADGSTSPNIQDVIVRYILAPDNNKRVFEYTIECTKKMRLLDNSFETRTPAQIINDLWALKQSGELLTLVDEDGTSHTVVISDTSPEVITPFPGDNVPEKYVYLNLFEM